MKWKEEFEEKKKLQPTDEYNKEKLYISENENEGEIGT